MFWGGLATTLTITAVPLLLFGVGALAFPTIGSLWRTANYHYERRHAAEWHRPTMRRISVFYLVGGAAIVAGSNLFPLVP